MDFNVNVNVKFDATPTLVGAVSTLVGALRPIEVLQQPVIAAPAIVANTARVQEEQETVQVSQEQQTSSGAPVAQKQPEPVEKQDEITDEMLRKIVGPVSKAKGKEAVFAILEEFGAKRVPDLKQEQRQAFIDKVNAL